MTLSLLADENIPSSLIRQLRVIDDFQVASVYEDNRGICDEDVLKLAAASDALVLTADLDFGELVMARSLKTKGVVLLRCHPIRQHINEIVSGLVNHAEDLPGHFVVISPNQIRLRRLPMGKP